MATLSSLLGTTYVGVQGKQGDIVVSNTVVVNPDTNPSVTDLTSSNTSLFTAQFSLPRASNVSIGTVSTGAAGSNATVTDSGTNGDVILDFTIPRGDIGEGEVTTGKAIAMAIVFG